MDVLEGVKDCRACPLGKGKGVPPDLRMWGNSINAGVSHPDILVVGEAPGREEVKSGIPMVGKSGTLARKLLARAGLATRVVIMNTVNCRPPANRDPNQEEIDACWQWFDYTMMVLGPRAVITMGKYSTKWIAGRKYGIGQNHGKVTERDGVYYPYQLSTAPVEVREGLTDLLAAGCYLRGDTNGTPSESSPLVPLGVDLNPHESSQLKAQQGLLPFNLEQWQDCIEGSRYVLAVGDLPHKARLTLRLGQVARGDGTDVPPPTHEPLYNKQGLVVGTCYTNVGAGSVEGVVLIVATGDGTFSIYHTGKPTNCRFKLNHCATSSKLYTLALYHPAYLLRQRGTKAYRDLEASTLQGMAELKHYLDHGREIPDYHAEVQSSYHIPANNQWAFDFETVGKDPRVAEPILLSVYEGGSSLPVVTNNVDAVKLWEGRPVAHQAQFDVVLGLRLGMPLPLKVDDTMVMAWMLGERHLALKDLARKELKIPTMSYPEMMETGGWGTAVNYSAQDSVLCASLFPLYWNRMNPNERAIYDTIEAPLTPILAKSTYLGLEVDQERARDMLQGEERKVALTKEVIHSHFPDLNPNSVPQKKAALKELFGVNMKSTDRDHLKALFAKVRHPFVRALISYSVANKAVGGHLKEMAESESISCLWNQTGAETGRLAATDLNLLNPTKRVQQCIRAREGFKFVSADYSQLEMRIAAVVSRDSRMIDSYQKGKDLHKELCLAVHGIQTETLRVQAKAANFEMLFGGGWRKLAAITGMPEREAQRTHQAHKGLYPRFHEWVKEVVKKGYDDGYSETLLGRRRHLWDRDSTDPDLQDKVRREAINSPIQGSGTDFTKLAMVMAHPLLGKIGGWLPLQVHDSLVAEVPEGETQAAGYILEHSMLGAIPKEIRDMVPFKVDIKIGEYLG